MPTSGGWTRRGAHLFLLILGIGACATGLVLIVGSDMFERIEETVAMGGGLICFAAGCAALQELILLGRWSLYKFNDAGGDFVVPFSPLPLLLSASTVAGCAIWTFSFFKSFGLSLPPFVFGAVAIALAPVVIACWRRTGGPLKLDSYGIVGVAPIDSHIAWNAIAHASIARRFGLPVIRLQKTASANTATVPAKGCIEFPAFDFGVPPRQVVEIINRRIAGQAIPGNKS
jgi:hypothetical protein